MIRNASHVHSTMTHHTYPITGKYTCKSSGVIYVITCSKCDVQYVGEIGTIIGQRMRGHRNKLNGGGGGGGGEMTNPSIGTLGETFINLKKLLLQL